MSEEILATNQNNRKWWLTKEMLIIEAPWGYTVYLYKETEEDE